MRITAFRRISQTFFLLWFLWFCIVTTVGDRWWQLRGWPVNWLMQLDPLVGLATLLTTGTLYAGLLWGVLTVVLSALFGRFFCGWVCPFGALHQLVGHLAHRRRKMAALLALNRYRRLQGFKYALLALLLAMAAGDLLARGWPLPRTSPLWFGTGIAAAAGFLCWHARRRKRRPAPALGILAAGVLAWWAAARHLDGTGLFCGALLTGLLDPLPLFYRAVNLFVLPWLDGAAGVLAAAPRYYAQALPIGALFLAAVLLNLHLPRFFCRYVCPLGALLGVLGRHAIWRIGRDTDACTACGGCRLRCEGACEPDRRIRPAECVLCLNCLDTCRHGSIGYRTRPSAAGEITTPDLTKRQLVAALTAGVLTGPLLRLDGRLARAGSPALVRPPGALHEAAFLARCISCGQCMRICPTNVIQPAGPAHGLARLWTPVLDFRVGTSGCQPTCIACGHVCPTAAIRPLSLSQRAGWDGEPIRIGTAFVDRGRCLPWAMDRPCIVCQENCPVSPKAIVTRDHLETVTGLADLRVMSAAADYVESEQTQLPAGRLATGDYVVRLHGESDAAVRSITGNTTRQAMLAPRPAWPQPPRPGTRFSVMIRLQQPVVEPERCIGCGICEHECPVSGQRAIRVTAERETRQPGADFLAPSAG